MHVAHSTKLQDNVRTALKAGVLTITIDRPEKKNALTAAMYTELAEAFEYAEKNEDVWVTLLHGDGACFTAGNDLEDFLRQPWGRQDMPPAVRFMYAVAEANKPVVAAVHGMAVGIGTTILLHCDLVYAAEDARFTMPFVNLGIVPEAGSTVLLPALVGRQVAAELLMLGASLSAQRAYQLGLVNAVVPGQDLLKTATEAAQHLASKPVAALRATKMLLKKAGQTELKRAMREEVEIVRERLDSPECKEALTAFLEKRKPDFSKFR